MRAAYSVVKSRELLSVSLVPAPGGGDASGATRSIDTLGSMSQVNVSAASSPASPPSRRSAGRPLPIVGVLALVLAAVSAVSLIVVLVAALFGRVVWPGFTLIPGVLFPVAFLLLCVELARTALRRRSG